MNECFDEEIPTSSPEQDATGEEMRIVTWQMVYLQRVNFSYCIFNNTSHYWPGRTYMDKSNTVQMW